MVCILQVDFLDVGQAIHLGAEKDEAYLCWVFDHYCFGQYQSAVAAFNQCIHLISVEVEDCYARGEAGVQPGRRQDGFDDFQTALKLAKEQGNIAVIRAAEEKVQEFRLPEFGVSEHLTKLVELKF